MQTQDTKSTNLFLRGFSFSLCDSIYPFIFLLSLRNYLTVELVDGNKKYPVVIRHIFRSQRHEPQK